MFLNVPIGIILADKLDPILIKHKDSIKNFAYSTKNSANMPGLDEYYKFALMWG